MNQVDTRLRSLLSVPFDFSVRPVDIAAPLRPAWRGAFLLLVLRQARGNTARLEVLHFLNWAVGSVETRQRVARAIELRDQMRAPLAVRFDTAVNRSLAYLSAEKLVRAEKGRWRLTATGKELAARISDLGVLAAEKEFLSDIAPINDSRMRVLFPEATT